MIARLLSFLAESRLEQGEGTVITGTPRSGTTLAMRVFCEGLTSAEERDGSDVNEPQPLSSLVHQGKVKEVLRRVPLALMNRHRVIKSPLVSLVLPRLKPKYRVVIIFRDLRLTIPSIFRHSSASYLLLNDDPYWLQYTEKRLPSDELGRATMACQLFYESALRYTGPIEVRSYGFWCDWAVRNQDTGALYERQGETSDRVLEDVRSGSAFSEASFDHSIWDEFCSEYGISKEHQEAILLANNSIKDCFRHHGLEARTLDDL